MSVLGNTVVEGYIRNNGLLTTNTLLVNNKAVEPLSGTIASNTSSTNLVSAAQVVAYIQSQSISPAATYYTTTNTGYGSLPVGWNSAQYYIKKATVSNVTGGELTFSKANLDYSDTDNGIYINVARAAASYTVSAAGWFDTATTALAASNTNKKYITGITVPKDKPFTISTTADTAYDATSNLTVTNAAYRVATVANSGKVNITSNASTGTINITNNSGTVNYGDWNIEKSGNDILVFTYIGS